MSSSTSSSTRPHSRGAHGGGGSHEGEDGGGGGGGGGGKLIKVAFARTRAEAEMMQALLLESDIPSVLKRARGFDAPEFLGGGPHEVFVNAAQAKDARELLEETMLGSEEDEVAGLTGARGGETSPARLAFWVLTAFVGAVALVWVLYQLS
ncbi:MAG TPA: hypothetical protein VK889_07485 [Solirubrobacterales bacterium]|nr:hypothetical protein [Solirubrobacterales bacterium]